MVRYCSTFLSNTFLKIDVVVYLLIYFISAWVLCAVQSLVLWLCAVVVCQNTPPEKVWLRAIVGADLHWKVRPPSKTAYITSFLCLSVAPFL